MLHETAAVMDFDDGTRATKQSHIVYHQKVCLEIKYLFSFKIHAVWMGDISICSKLLIHVCGWSHGDNIQSYVTMLQSMTQFACLFIEFPNRFCTIPPALYHRSWCHSVTPIP